MPGWARLSATGKDGTGTRNAGVNGAIAFGADESDAGARLASEVACGTMGAGCGMIK